MPRTKVPRKKAAVKSSLVKITVKELRALRDREVKQLIATRDILLKKTMEKMQFMKLSLSHPERTLKELRESTVHSTMMRTACDNLEYSTTNSIHKSQKKKKRSLSCAPEDDGDSASSRGMRTSRARSRAPLANSTARVSRSLSRSRAQQEVPVKLNTKTQGYKTPTGKQPSKAYGMITPKMQPNTPQLILRRPKHGEMAVSLEGSPLMVNPVAADTKANVNIPLGEGKLFSLQPERGLRISQLPHLDPETQRQLQTLSEHLQKICAASKRL